MFTKFLITTILFLALPSWAQMMNTSMAGAGVWPGNQGCSYQQAPAQAVNTESDKARRIESKMERLQKKIADKQNEKKKYDRELTTAERGIKKNISEDYADFILQHMASSRRCVEYVAGSKSSGNAKRSTDDEGAAPAMERAPQGTSSAARGKFPGPPPNGAGGNFGPPPDGSDFEASGEEMPERPNDNMLTIQAFTPQEWQDYCDARQNGSVFTGVCDNSKFRASGHTNASTCHKAIVSYRTNAQKSAKLQDDIDDLNGDLEQLQDDLEIARDDKGTTEGACQECMARGNSYNYQPQQQSNTANLVANVLLAGGSMLANYKTNQMISENNANLGAATQASALSYGYPFVMQNMYGSIASGSGQGGFGCGGGLNMQGQNGGSSVFGYPANMMMGNQMMAGLSSGAFPNQYSMSAMGNQYGVFNNPFMQNNQLGLSAQMGIGNQNPFGNYNSMYNLNSMYGANMYGQNSQYTAMNSLQQQIAMMTSQLSAMQSMSGSYNTGYNTYPYTGATSTYISPSGLTTSAGVTTLPGGVIAAPMNASSYLNNTLNTSLTGYNYGSTYISPYSSVSSSITVPGIVPMTTTSDSSTAVGTGR